MRFAYFVIPVLVLIMVFGGGFLVFRFSVQVQENTLPVSEGGVPMDGDPQESQRYWENRIESQGATNAYEEFKQAFASTSFSTQHLYSHLIGEMLYQKLGMEGVAVCDATFAFGCYHSLFGLALAEHGMEAVSQLDHACVEKFGDYGTGCQHGIGHGLLEYFGRKNLVQALEGCGLTRQLQKRFGCTSGVFMEYNVPILITPEFARTEVRQPQEENPYAPCNTIVPEQFRESCYYEMGQWWDKVYEGDYEKIGELCKDLQESAWRESCYLGTGNVVAPVSNYDVVETIAECGRMPDQRGELLCRAGASWSFFAVPELRDLAPLLCEGLIQDSSHRCVQRSDLISMGEIS